MNKGASQISFDIESKECRGVYSLTLGMREEKIALSIFLGGELLYFISYSLEQLFHIDEIFKKCETIETVYYALMRLFESKNVELTINNNQTNATLSFTLSGIKIQIVAPSVQKNDNHHIVTKFKNFLEKIDKIIELRRGELCRLNEETENSMIMLSEKEKISSEKRSENLFNKLIDSIRMTKEFQSFFLLQSDKSRSQQELLRVLMGEAENFSRKLMSEPLLSEGKGEELSDVFHFQKKVKKGLEMLEENQDKYIGLLEKRRQSIIGLFQIFFRRLNAEINLFKKEINIMKENLVDENSKLINKLSDIKELVPEEVNITKTKSIFRIKAHTCEVFSLCMLKDGRIASCSYDKTIKIYDLVTSKCELIIKETNSPVTSICVLENGYLLSSTRDGTLKIFEIKRLLYNCVKILIKSQIQANVVCSLSGNKICAGFYDSKIRIWDADIPNELIITLSQPQDSVEMILELKSKSYFVTTNGGNVLYFWGSEDYEMKKKLCLNGVLFCFSIFEISENKLLVGSIDEVIIISSNTFQVETVVSIGDDFAFINCFMSLRDGNVLFGTSQGNLYYYDTKTINLKGKLNTEEESGFSFLLPVSYDTFASASGGGILTLWKL